MDGATRGGFQLERKSWLSSVFNYGHSPLECVGRGSQLGVDGGAVGGGMSNYPLPNGHTSVTAVFYTLKKVIE